MADESKIVKTSIRHKPWKVKFSPKITDPDVGLYSLFDLLFYEVESEEGIVIKKRLNATFNQSKGLSLAHDLICYNVNFMQGQSVDRNLDTSYNAWAVMGFDLGFVDYDKRSKSRTVKIKAQNSKKTFNVRIFDKSAAIFPDTSEDMYGLNTPFSQLLKRDNITRGEANNSIWQSTNYFPYTVNVDSSSDRTADIYLVNSDSIFTQTLITKTGYTAYNTLCLNTTDDIRYFVNCIIGYNSGYVRYKDLAKYEYDEEAYESPMIDFFNIQQSSAVNIVFDKTDADNNEAIIDVLKHTYVWLRCSYFGDYVNPDDFNQSLDQKSDVKFGNLMIGSKGDFNRYDDRDSTNERYKSETTRPYLAQTAPSEDLLSKRIAENAGIDIYDQYDTGTELRDGKQVDKSISSQVDALMKATEIEDETVIGSLWNETLSRDSDEDHSDPEVDAVNHLSPPQYFDPEQVKSKLALERSEHVPVLVPKNGNIMTEGRIISPTIDEIWVYFKKLVSGHASDYENEEKVNADGGLIVNDSRTKNENDTRLKEGRPLVFNGTYSKDVEGKDQWLDEAKGDPIELEITESEENQRDRLIVKNWVAAPESFRYAIYEFLKAENEIITQFEDDYADGKFKTLHTIFDTTAPKNNIHYDQNTTVTTVRDGEMITPAMSDVYSPREKPYSLRELEAELKNTKYNLNTMMRYLVANFTLNNQLSKRTNQSASPRKTFVYFINGSYYSDIKGLSPYKRHLQEEFSAMGEVEPGVYKYSVLWTDIDYTNRQASGLYQFHRDYNSRIDTPNTWFNKDSKEISPETGTAAVFDDSGLDSFDQHKDSYKYGDAITLPNKSDDYSASDVYLAADGTWRYVFDHVRLPVLDCEY